MVAKVVLVTSCSTGIGRQAVAQLTTAGRCTVVATARAVDSLECVAAATSAPAGKAQPRRHSVAHLARRSRPKGAIPT
jgi:NADP-dependent 3-hydroxy acid dehydrogenase YdfG